MSTDFEQTEWFKELKEREKQLIKALRKAQEY